MTRFALGARGLPLLLSIFGCAANHDPDTGPSAADVTMADCGPAPTGNVSLLWIVQNQNNPEDLQYRLSPTVDELVRELSTRLAGRLRVAAINGSVEPGAMPVTGCDGPGVGDVFHTFTFDDGTVAGPIIELGPDGDVERAIGEARAVASTFGDVNCANQLLESGLRALAPASLGFPLPHGMVHGDVENAGFVERGDVLLIVFATYLDDCSWNERVVPGARPDCPAGGPLICCEEVLFPVSRYIEWYRRLADALGVRLVMATLSAASVADRSVAEWRESGPLLCGSASLLNLPLRLLEVMEAFGPLTTSQPLCSGSVGSPLPDIPAIVDLVVEASSCP